METNILNYEDTFVVEVLAQKLNLSKEKASDLFRDTVQFLYLCSTSDKSLAPPRAIDDAWHEFISCTENYRIFCNELGVFIDHRPAINGVVVGVSETLYELHARTLTLAKNYFGKLSPNFQSGTDALKWCCHSVPEPRPTPKPKFA